MAGDWTKIEHALPDKPEVNTMSLKLRIEVDLVVGKLLRLWRWVDVHADIRANLNGHVSGIDDGWIDAHVRLVGFSDALRNVKWLRNKKGGVIFPRVGKHLGLGAKARAGEAVRKRMQREKCPDKGQDKGPDQRREEKRREEKRREDSEKSASEALACAAKTAAAGPQPAKPTKPRKRNLIWDAVVDSFALKIITKTDATRMGKVVRDLKAKGATPELIVAAVARYRAEWPSMECTPEALLKNWQKFSTDSVDNTTGASLKRGDKVVEEEKQRELALGITPQ